MVVRTVLVCGTQVPFVTGGAESLVRGLVDRLRAAGYETDLVSIPFKGYPKEEILANAAAWRLLDLTESDHKPVDVVICTKFPTYFVRHPNKVVWLTHQHRAAYDLCGTEYSDFMHVDLDVGLRERLHVLDREMLGECRRRYSISVNTATRLQRFNGLKAEPLYHPPSLADRLRHESYGSYVLSVGRLNRIKRVDLAIEAMPHVHESLCLIIAGEGPDEETLRGKAADAGVSHRVEFRGRVSEEALVDLYANARAVVYPPYDEDYGYVTLEAFLACKPVVTTTDSGGPLEFVEHDVSGIVCDPEAHALAAALNTLVDEARARALGEAGHARASRVTWDGVIQSLVSG